NLPINHIQGLGISVPCTNASYEDLRCIIGITTGVDYPYLSGVTLQGKLRGSRGNPCNSLYIYSGDGAGEVFSYSDIKTDHHYFFAHSRILLYGDLYLLRC